YLTDACKGRSSAVRTPSRDTDLSRTDSSDSDYRRSGLRTSETLVGKELDQLREYGAPRIHPALSRLRRSPEKGAEHDDYRHRLPPELSDDCIFNGRDR